MLPSPYAPAALREITLCPNEMACHPKPARAQGGGWGEIRTHGELAPTAVFKTAALNHSATHPIPAFPT